MNVKKEAEKDAHEAARADMYYGEGAGTRRKLIQAIVVHKSNTIPGYGEAFDEAYYNQDWERHAKAARKERKHKDVSKRVDRNVRGLATGNRASMTTDVMIAASVAYFAHQVGLDKAAWEFGKKKYYHTKAWINYKRKLAKAKNDTNVTVMQQPVPPPWQQR